MIKKPDKTGKEQAKENPKKIKEKVKILSAYPGFWVNLLTLEAKCPIKKIL